MGSICSRLRDVQRITVKVGTSTLTYDSGKLNLDRMEHLVGNWLTWPKWSSSDFGEFGAIAVGRSRLRVDYRPKTTPEKQALAAVGRDSIADI